MDKKVKILIVEDHKFFRMGLKMTLEDFDFVEKVIEATNGKEFLEIIKYGFPDLILMDINMPEMDGIEATKLALSENPDLNIVALSAFGEEEHLQKMLQAGIKGFLLKSIEPEGLKHALKVILSGKSFFSEELLPYFTDKYLRKITAQEDNFSITRRELEVLMLIAQGFSSKEIADKMAITPRTVEGHKANLISKTGSKSTLELLIFSIKNKLISL
ncbi:MAG: response regulator transcription factor [Prolixibacteraceae bacterium]|nr:response regulator transcription factor [Prolixibacteraceae bacterium]MBN2775270.1 response regulator transcription factor [Prolixibacteraceae bacterium]